MIRKVFWFLCIIGVSFFQTDLFSQEDAQREQQRKERREQRMREAQKRQYDLFKGKPPEGTVSVFGRSFISSVDKGFINTILLLESGKSKSVRGELGISDEQGAQLQALADQVKMQALFKGPQYAERFKKMTEADKEGIQKDIEKEFQTITDLADKLATPEQKSKAKTLAFQTMGGLDSPIINIDAMASLNLSEEQKEKAAKTFEEMKEERIAQMEEGLKLIEKAVQLGGVNMSPEDRKMLEEEGKALEARILATGKKLGDRLRTHLTSEQLALEKKLLANRPKFLPRLPKQLRGDYTETYVPGVDSWEPGQGVPEDQQKKIKRKSFPREETD